MILILDLSSENFERRIEKEKAKGSLHSEEARWLTIAVSTFLGIRHETPPLVANEAFIRFNKKLPHLRLNGNLLEVSKVDGMVTLHTPKPRIPGKLNVLA